MQTFRQLEQKISCHQEQRRQGIIELGRILDVRGKHYAAPILEEIKKAQTIEWIEELLTLLKEGDVTKGIAPFQGVSRATWHAWVKAAEARAAHLRQYPTSEMMNAAFDKEFK